MKSSKRFEPEESINEEIDEETLRGKLNFFEVDMKKMIDCDELWSESE